jgi:hypothetical protein
MADLSDLNKLPQRPVASDTVITSPANEDTKLAETFSGYWDDIDAKESESKKSAPAAPPEAKSEEQVKDAPRQDGEPVAAKESEPPPFDI